MNQIYSSEKHLSSYTFFNDILPQVNKALCKKSYEAEIVFNFSDVKSIEPLVIPNLLCLGILCKSEHLLPYLEVPSFFSSNNNVMGYLYSIGFKTINRKYSIYGLDDALWGGFPLYKKIESFLKEWPWFPEINYDLFKEKLTFEMNSNDIKKILIKADYKKLSSADDLASLLVELVCNSLEHGHSNAFLSVSYNKAFNLIQIAESDLGVGLFSSISKRCKDYPEVLDPHKIVKPEIVECIQVLMKDAHIDVKNKDIYAILCTLLFRCKIPVNRTRQIYGIFSIFVDVLNNHGTIRIHTNSTQVIFTHKHMDYFIRMNEDEGILIAMQELAQDLIHSKSTRDMKYKNVRTNLQFPGVHFEIELPAKKEGKATDGLL